MTSEPPQPSSVKAPDWRVVHRLYSRDVAYLGRTMGMPGTPVKRSVEQVFHALQQHLGTIEHFVDVGSGNGRMLFAALCFGAKRISGVEVDEGCRAILEYFCRKCQLSVDSFSVAWTDVAQVRSFTQQFGGQKDEKVIFAFDDGWNYKDRHYVYELCKKDSSVKVVCTTKQACMGSVSNFHTPDKVQQVLGSGFNFAETLLLNLAVSNERKTLWVFKRVENTSKRLRTR